MEKQNINVDINEVEKFNKIAHKWWDPSSEFKPLHDINPLRVNYINDLFPLDKQNILDVGCGGGILAESMAKLGGNVTGIDQSEIAIKIAQLHAKENNLSINYKLLNIEDFLKKDSSKFDVITCLEMIEHVPDPASIITSCSKKLKKNGRLYVSTINRNLKAFLFAIVGAEYILNLLPRGTHHYDKFIKPSEVKSWANGLNMNISNITGMTYNPFLKKYSLGSDVSVNYILELRFNND
ncbi:MAG: bifunctional 2-polyprenyl-6-hydroxyphenol methylase/3-demethylubiquinol 3-O-methyltransferase UbiG [Methylophilaceae bacterium]|mgnify:CR=1 FL=1|jgi:2-polyprenyl-6-hydroxyphenyl methylase/3-demethylubiquinone-9 3-methyltransferase|nr:bifunctional 2-polyprenyl-6-hydroxyphenol methylase/3-demethylubiquinol 3-O-methyltransferase UbiG [Methylophilaceae bacterium]NCV53496.1 bifunctional 2-polyprenyl-6-hydroxyphenol methylase/3-demethylubiquinol 3-O-methyltransferase UbiG [Betaproteobacteria bacterium]NCW62984.1 bifunctional 2-polyprenyl-6-hydroxyphenol methylase/3-demethylubiquinol 3-O-methyltransferase UbiG [Betaproteobacteria bacterium]NCX67585.1 bifunctional 2-polyprenyl-6-hydroxyphenol methylase/3-demethylubiquinol 3-O-met